VTVLSADKKVSRLTAEQSLALALYWIDLFEEIEPERQRIAELFKDFLPKRAPTAAFANLSHPRMTSRCCIHGKAPEDLKDRVQGADKEREA
jgi:hypothetical protein